MVSLKIGDKPLSEPMLTRFTDAYMRHDGEMSSVGLITQLRLNFNQIAV